MATTNSVAKRLIGSFRDIGVTAAQVRRLLPEWWEDEAADDPGGLLELQMLLARRLNVSIDSLQAATPAPQFHGGIRRFKTIHPEGSDQLMVASALGVAIARLVLSATDVSFDALGTVASIRKHLIADGHAVTLDRLCSHLWAHGVPVVHMTGWPQGLRRPDAMCMQIEGRPVILIVRKESAAAKLTYLVAHELGHLLAGHLAKAASSAQDEVLVDDALPVGEDDAVSDREEKAADALALDLLGGKTLNAASEAIPTSLTAPLDIVVAALKAVKGRPLDAGQAILGWGRITTNWKAANGALRYLMTTDVAPVVINDIAAGRVELSSLSADNREHLAQITGLGASVEP